MHGQRTRQGTNQRPKSVYQRNPITLYFNNSAPSPSSQASSIEEDNRSYGSYSPNSFSISLNADTVKTMKPVLFGQRSEASQLLPQKVASLPDEFGTNTLGYTFFSKRLQQLEEFRQLHNVNYVQDVQDVGYASPYDSPNTSNDNNSNSPNTSQEYISDQEFIGDQESISTVIKQTERLPTALRKDFVDNVYTLMVLSQSSKQTNSDGNSTNNSQKSIQNSKEEDTIRSNIITTLQNTASPASPASLDETIATILFKHTSSSSNSPLIKAISIALSNQSIQSDESIDEKDINWKNNAKNWTLLHLAVINQKLDDVKALLNPSDTSDKLPLFEPDTDGLTPLHWAVLKSDTVNGHNILRELLGYIGKGEENSNVDISGKIAIINKISQSYYIII